MRADNGFQAQLIDHVEDLRRRVIRQVPVGATNTLAQGWRIVGIRQHLEIVITLQNQGIATTKRLHQMRRGLPGVGQHAEPATSIAGDILHRLACVMRNGIRRQFQVAYRQPLSVAAKVENDVIAMFLHCLIGAEAEPDRNAMAACELEYAADMVLVLMGNDDTRQVSRAYAQSLQAPFRLADGESAIEHDNGARRSRHGGNQQRITFAAASQTGKLQ